MRFSKDKLSTSKINVHIAELHNGLGSKLLMNRRGEVPLF